MTKLKPTTSSVWEIETSHLVAVPRTILAASVQHLKDQVQYIADTKGVRVDRPPIGVVVFTEEPDRLHCFFTDRHGKRRRFMRLRRGG